MSLSPGRLFFGGLSGGSYIKAFAGRAVFPPGKRTVLTVPVKNSTVRQSQSDPAPGFRGLFHNAVPAVLQVIKPHGKGQTFNSGEFPVGGETILTGANHHALLGAGHHPFLKPAPSGDIGEDGGGFLCCGDRRGKGKA